MQILDKVRRLLPIILSITAFTVGVVGTAVVLKGFDLQTTITSFYAQKVTVADLQLGKIKPVLLIDVRSPEEYAEDRIGNSQLVPVTEIEDGKGVEKVKAIAQSSVQPNQPKPTVILYCTSGQRSTKAYRLLENSGLNIAVLSGGITAWREIVPPQKDATILGPIAIPAKNTPHTK